MFRGSKRLLVAAAAVVLALVVPTVALAGSGAKCSASACQVYIEQGAGNGTGSRPAGGSTSTTPLPIPKKTAQAIKRAGKYANALENLAANPALGGLRGLAAAKGYGQVTAPSALGSAFDVGSGPTALFATLASLAVLLLAAAGYGSWRRRRSAS